jgi:hypothetical protein
MGSNSIIGKIFAWVWHPQFDTDTDPVDWVAGLAIVVLLAFLWSRVVKQIVEV